MDLSKFLNKPCIVTFKTGMKFWSYIYDGGRNINDGDKEYAIRLENGWYQYYKADGTCGSVGVLILKNGIHETVVGTGDETIVNVMECEFQMAESIAMKEGWDVIKGGTGWNNYVLHPVK